MDYYLPDSAEKTSFGADGTPLDGAGMYLLNILGQVSRIANPTYTLQLDCPKFLSRYAGIPNLFGCAPLSGSKTPQQVDASTN
jgi:hypothetical protein